MTRVVDGPEILEMRRVARAVPIARPVQAYAIRLTLGSHPASPYATPLVKNTCATARARARRRRSCSPARSTRSTAARHLSRSMTSVPSPLPALRHRILLNFEGEADEVNTDTIVDELIASIATD